MVVSDVSVWAVFNLIITSDTSKLDNPSLYSPPLSVFFIFPDHSHQYCPSTKNLIINRNTADIWSSRSKSDKNMMTLLIVFRIFLLDDFFPLLFLESRLLCKPGVCCILLWPNSDSQLPEQCCQYQLDIWLATQTGLKLKEFTKFNQIHV